MYRLQLFDNAQVVPKTEVCKVDLNGEYFS